MSPLPQAPFLTKDFSPRGGGIDFLGLRYVNLHMVGTNLIPELNNVTRDIGTFFIGAWIPWRFAETCKERRKKSDYTEKHYRAFREKIEVAMSLTMRDESTAAKKHGQVRNRVGITQQCQLPAELSYEGARRGPQNSLYAAAIYGPAIQALHMIDSYRALAEDAHTIEIPVVSTDPDTATILAAVDRNLARASAYRHLISLESHRFTWQEIDELGSAGLCPSTYRADTFKTLKPCFQHKLLPTDPQHRGYARTRTTRLLIETLRQKAPFPVDAIRDAWYTGHYPDGSRLEFGEKDTRAQCAQWSYFMARQYQRYAIELFLWCFEVALRDGCRSVDEAIEFWEDRTRKAGERLVGDFRAILESVADGVLRADDLKTSEEWNVTVHGEHDQIEYVEEPQNDSACLSGLRMFAGWYWRMLIREQDEANRNLMTLGQSDRIGMTWFLDWLRRRQRTSVRTLLKDIFSDLVFSQHMRVALARFDGNAQRLRFVLGDRGIEPTVSAKTDLGKRDLPWMPDRLDTLVALLCDIDVLQIAGDGTVSLGPRANTI